mgnify:CR=1 FL=1
MTVEKKDNKTFFLIVGVCSFLVIGLVSILKARETEHLNYGENTSVQQEAVLYNNVKDYNNVVEPVSTTAPVTVAPIKHTMKNTQPAAKQSTYVAPEHTMKNTQWTKPATQAPEHAMKNTH